MFLISGLWWLVTLPVRLVFWLLGVTLWVLTLPLRLVFGLLGFIGTGRIFRVGVIGALGYFFYRLVNDPGPEKDDAG